MAGFGLLLAAAGGPVLAQSTAPDALPPQSVPDAVPPAGTPDAPPEKIEPERPIAPEAGTLSEQLDRSNGVIVPAPTTDKGAVRPPPDNGAAVMPVIPPPGTPENQPNVKPK